MTWRHCCCVARQSGRLDRKVTPRSLLLLHTRFCCCRSSEWRGPSRPWSTWTGWSGAESPWTSSGRWPGTVGWRKTRMKRKHHCFRQSEHIGQWATSHHMWRSPIRRNWPSSSDCVFRIIKSYISERLLLHRYYVVKLRHDCQNFVEHYSKTFRRLQTIRDT